MESIVSRCKAIDKRKFLYIVIGVALSVFIGILLNLLFTYVILKKDSGYCGYAVWITTSLIVFVLYEFRDTAIRKMEVLFSITALLMGTFFITVSPATVGVSWDDQIHYGRTVTIINYLGGRYSKADEDDIGNVAEISGTFGDETHSGLTREGRRNLSKRLDKEYASYENGANFVTAEGSYSIAYIPSFIGIVLGRILHLSWVTCFNMGRFFNLLAYVIVIALAISRLKNGKLICALAGLVPSSVFLAASYSYDPWVISWTILGFSEFYRMMMEPEKKIQTKEWIKMLLIFAVGFMPKMVYIVMLLPLIFVSSERFENKKTAVLMKAGIIIIAVILALLAVAPEVIRGTLAAGDSRGGDGVNSGGQVQFILNHPLKAAIIVVRFFIDYAGLSTGSYVQFFAYLGGGRFEALTFAVLFIAAFAEENKYSSGIGKAIRLTGIIGIVLTIFAFIMSLYISFNPVGSESIGGVQGRYIIPLIFPLLYFIRPEAINVSWKSEKYAVVPVAFFALTFIYNIYTNVVAFY